MASMAGPSLSQWMKRCERAARKTKKKARIGHEYDATSSFASTPITDQAINMSRQATLVLIAPSHPALLSMKNDQSASAAS